MANSTLLPKVPCDPMLKNQKSELFGICRTAVESHNAIIIYHSISHLIYAFVHILYYSKNYFIKYTSAIKISLSPKHSMSR